MRTYIRHRRKTGLIAALAVLAVIAVTVVSLRITEVKVSGNTRYTAEEIEQTIFDSSISRNAAYCYFQYQFRPHKKLPFVEDYRIVFRGPNEVEIIVYEKSMVGYVSYMNSNLYFDKDGIIVESTSEILPGIPKIEGLKFGHVVLHEPLPVENKDIFEDILNLTQILSLYEIHADGIRYQSGGRAVVTVGNLRVELGDKKDMNGKIAELSDIIREYSDLDGTLYLDTYDETNSNPMYRFQKNEP